MFAYNASKAAVNVFTIHLAAKLPRMRFGVDLLPYEPTCCPILFHLCPH
jgi:hypothetical protein